MDSTHATMMHRAFLARAFLIPICLVTAGCRKPPDASPEDGPGSGIEVEAGGVHGVILPAEAANRDIGWTGGERWTPSRDEALEADAIARECVEREAPEVHARYEEYTRQYVGYLDGGRKLVFINYFFERPDLDDWKESLVRVKDGGIAYFEVRVDMETSSCVQVYVHGEA